MYKICMFELAKTGKKEFKDWLDYISASASLIGKGKPLLDYLRYSYTMRCGTADKEVSSSDGDITLHKYYMSDTFSQGDFPEVKRGSYSDMLENLKKILTITYPAQFKWYSSEWHLYPVARGVTAFSFMTKSYNGLLSVLKGGCIRNRFVGVIIKL